MESMTSSGCWTCLCKPSVKHVGDGDGRVTTYWAGEECQKKDISVPFHLFFWVTPLSPTVHLCLFEVCELICVWCSLPLRWC